MTVANFYIVKKLATDFQETPASYSVSISLCICKDFCCVANLGGYGYSTKIQQPYTNGYSYNWMAI